DFRFRVPLGQQLLIGDDDGVARDADVGRERSRRWQAVTRFQLPGEHRLSDLFVDLTAQPENTSAIQIDARQRSVPASLWHVETVQKWTCEFRLNGPRAADHSHRTIDQIALHVNEAHGGFRFGDPTRSRYRRTSDRRRAAGGIR